VSASVVFLYRQTLLFGQILRSSADHHLRVNSFVGDGSVPQPAATTQCIGAPCQEFIPEMVTHAVQYFGDMNAAVSIAVRGPAWKSLLREHVLSKYSIT